MSEFKPITCIDQEKVNTEELYAFAMAIPRMLHLISIVRSIPRLYHSRLPCFLQGFCYGAKFQFSIGHLLELWEQGYMRDGDLFFYGGTSSQDGNFLYGLNSRTGEQLTIVGSSSATSIAAHRVWGHPSDRTVIQPVFSGERVQFSKLLERIYTTPLKEENSFLPKVIPFFLKRIEEMNFKPLLPEMEFVPIPSGEFMMGLTEGKSEFFDKPFSGSPVQVNSFEMLSTPVTVKMWSSVTNQRPEGIQGDCSAVDWANWHECMAFARILSSIDNEFDYRLPTEAEWEYACRAGTTTEYYSGDEPPRKPSLVLQGCNLFGIRFNSPVKTSIPNPWGLFDMGELVSEWCTDSYNPVFSLPEITSGLTNGGYRVIKGGARSNGMLLPASWSDCSVPWVHGSKENGTGFRLIRTPKKVTS